MSWYYFGGFSAYAIEPSARTENHFGCSLTHGWSGDACRARSIETSRPSARAWLTKYSKSSKVPSSGWIASWPPSSDPIAHGEPGSPGYGSSVLFGPLRNEWPIGWIGGT